MADNTLRINVEVDASQLGVLAAASRTVAESNTALEGSFNGVAGAGLTEEQALNFVTVAANALKTTSASVTTQDIEEAAALDRVAVASAALVPQLEKVNAVQGVSAIQARLTTDVLTGNIARAENALIRFAGHSEALAPIIQGLFIPFTIAIFAELLYTVAERIYNVYENVVLLKESLHDMQVAAEAEAHQAANLNETYLESVARRLEAQGKLTEAAAAYKKASEAKPLELMKIDDKQFKEFNAEFVSFMRAVHSTSEAPTVIKRIGEEVASTSQQLAEARQKLNSLIQGQGEAMKVGDMAAAQMSVVLQQHQNALIDSLLAKLGRLQAAIGEVQSQTGTTGNRLTDDEERLNKKGKDTKADSGKEVDDARRATREAELAFQESVFKREYEAHRISLQEELTDLRNVETQKLTIINDSLDAEERDVRAHAKPDEDISGKLAVINQKREKEQFDHVARMSEIDATGTRDQARIDEDAAMAHIKAVSEMQKSDDALAVSRAGRTFEKAETPPEIAVAGGDKIKAQNQDIDNQIAALKQEQALLEKGPKDQGGQLIDPRALEQIQTVKTAIHDLENTRLRDTEETNAQIQTRTASFYKGMLEDQLTTINAQMRVSEDAARQEESDLKTKLDEKQISLREYVREANAVVEQEYQAQHAELERERVDFEAAAAKKIITAEELARKLAEIAGRDAVLFQQKNDQIDKNNQLTYKKMAEDINKFFAQVNNEMNNTVIQMIQKQKTFAQGMAEVWNDIAQSAIKYMLQMLEQWIETHIIMAAIQKAMAALGLDTGGDDVAKKKIATAAAVVEADAAQASADVFLQTIEGVPFPADLVAAPIAAAATHTAVMALAAFEQGGIVPGRSGEAMPIYAHAKEMILPENISSAVTGAVPAIHKFNESMEGGSTSTLNRNIQNMGGSTSSSTTTHGPQHVRMENHFHSDSGQLSHEDIVKSMRLAIRRGEVGLR